ncbi:unnamed protein product [Peronospora belbahrii]|uniref:RxLR effector protein n=1 Tax=Peronospora belbahrii TaxID=622444 RepID=A0AAU9KS62_9STRA|nr:unnamed protein product [Peronospora belbahrii]
MFVEFSAAKSSFVKILLVIALVACSATSEIPPELVSEGSSRALNTVHAAENSVVDKQYLRSDVPETTSNQNTVTFEDRINGAHISTSDVARTSISQQLKSKISTTYAAFIEKMKPEWWQLRKSPDKLFDYVKVKKANVNPGEDPFARFKFEFWSTVVFLFNPEDPMRHIRSVLLDKFEGEHKLAAAVQAALNEKPTLIKEFMLENLQAKQFALWLQNDIPLTDIKNDQVMTAYSQFLISNRRFGGTA